MRKKFCSILLTVHTVFCIILLQIPIVLDIRIKVTEVDTFPIYFAIKSIDYEISLYVSLVAALIMSLELIFRLSVEPSLIFSFKNFLATILLILWLIIPDSILLTYVTKSLDFKIFNILHQSRFILLSWSVCIYLNLYCERKIWGSRWTIYSVMFYNSIRVINSFCLFYTIPKLSVKILFFFLVLSLFILVVQSLRWFLFIYKSSKLRRITTDQYLCGIYIFSYLCCNVGVIGCVLTRKDPIWYNMSTKDLISQTYVYTVFYVVFAAFQGRVIEREAIISQNALEVKQMFIRYMSHEIRTPLNTVMMGLQHLQEDMKKCGDSPQRIEIVEDTIESCEIAVKTLNNMLLYDKIETKLLALDKSTIKVIPFINKIIQLFRTQAAHLKVNLSVTYLTSTEDGTPVNWKELTLYVDAEKIAQVVRNVISNAIKFTPPGGNIAVEVKKLSTNIATSSASSTTSELVQICVSDTGAGISLENQAKLFHGIIQFLIGKLQDGGGSGLGLYIAKGIVDAHGGVIAVTSEGEGQGSTFTITLPLSGKPAQQESPLITIDRPRSTLFRALLAKRSDHNSNCSNKSSKVRATVERLWNSQVLPVDRQKSYHDNSRNPDDRGYKPLPPPSIPLVAVRSIIDNMNAYNSVEVKAHDSVEEEKNDDDDDYDRHMEVSPASFSPLVFCRLNENKDVSKRSAKSMKKKKPVILVVDDVASNRKMLHRLLQDRCEYSEDAVNGQEAVSMIRDAMSQGRHIDIITMDYQMPVMDGPTATRQIRELGYKGIILGVTGNALAKDTNDFIACGVDKVLIKPLDVKAFDKAVLELLPSSSMET